MADGEGRRSKKKVKSWTTTWTRHGCFSNIASSAAARVLFNTTCIHELLVVPPIGCCMLFIHELLVLQPTCWARVMAPHPHNPLAPSPNYTWTQYFHQDSSLHALHASQPLYLGGRFLREFFSGVKSFSFHACNKSFICSVSSALQVGTYKSQVGVPALLLLARK